MNKLIKEFKYVSQLNAPSGLENQVREYLKVEFGKLSKTSEFDNLGSTFATFGQGGLKIMIAAHMDEVGYLVTDITNEGFVKVINLGGIIPAIMSNSPVTLLGDNGEVPGVILGVPAHHFKENKNPEIKIEDLVIDVGATNIEEVKKLGIHKGTFVTPKSEFLELANSRIATKAIDNRFGCVLAVDIAKELTDNLNNTIIIGATVQEETGLRGIRTAINRFKPDIFIAIDASSSTDYFETKDSIIKLGNGFLLRHMDPAMISNVKLKNKLKQVALENDIKFQDFTSKGATDAAMAQVGLEGVPSIVVGVPIRGIHTNYSVIDLSDYEMAKRAVMELISSIEEKDIKEYK